VALDPDAVELVDRTMIELGRAIPIYRPTLQDMLIGEPGSLLIVEFHGESDGPLLAKLDELDTAMADLGHPNAVVRATEEKFQARIAAVREAGLNIMMSMKGDAKPVSFIEDCAVPLADLADYTERLTAVFDRYGVKGTWYAHASVGCLHVRPVLNMKDPGDARKMRAVAEECFALVRSYKGSHSGEHGDGIARSEFHERMFGSRIVRAFESVKDAFDPEGLFNPNRIVRPPRFDDASLFRTPPGYAPLPLTAKLDWSEHPGGLLGAAEMCNNNGTCRGFDAEVMCPSYRATRDERDVVRGRANTLRLALSRQLGPAGLAGEEVADALKLCVSCKACRRECPTGVDMARMKIEALAARAERRGLTPRDLAVAFLPRIAPFAARLPQLANAAQRALARRIGFARNLPSWRGDRFRDGAADPGDGREVILFADTFSRWFEPENLRAALRVLRVAGLRPVLPRVAGRPLCCGRTYLAVGLVERARAEARRTLAALAGDAPVLGLEPSCLFTLKDEFPSLLPGAEARWLASRAMLLSEFLEREHVPLPLGRLAATAHVHGHCHQKSFGAFPAALSALRRVPGLSVAPIASSCCGMAGAFGYQMETQEASRAMAEAALLPAVRAAAADDLIVADGTSCRAQILGLAGRSAVHSVQVLARALTTP
jgi:Fe-S oxidoreductase